MTEKAEILDDLDRKILSKLMADSSQAYSDIAKELFVSAGTVHVRMKKMIQLGVVKGEYLEVDYHKLGYDVTAFLGIFLDKSSLYDPVTEQLNKIPEVV